MDLDREGLDHGDLLTGQDSTLFRHWQHLGDDKMEFGIGNSMRENRAMMELTRNLKARSTCFSRTPSPILSSSFTIS